MKGTLHKTESGWQVWYYVKEARSYNNTGIKILPLIDNGHIDGLKLYDSNEGLEVEFEIVDEIIDLGRHGSTVVEKAKIVANWLTIKEGGWVVNYCIIPEFDEPISLLKSIRANPSWDKILKEFISANSQTNPLTFELWLVDNYNPPTKKQDHDK